MLLPRPRSRPNERRILTLDLDEKPGDPHVAPPRADGFNDSEFYGVSATIEGDMGFGTLTVIPAYRKSKPDYLSYVPGFFGRVTENDDQMSLEVRLTSNSDRPLRYVLGGYFFHEKQETSNYFVQA